MLKKFTFILAAAISLRASAMETFDLSQRPNEDLITISSDGPFCTFTDTIWYGNTPVRKNDDLKGTSHFSTQMKLGDLRANLSSLEKSIIFDRLSICDAKVNEKVEIRIENQESAEIKKLSYGISDFSPKHNTAQKFYKLILR